MVKFTNAIILSFESITFLYACSHIFYLYKQVSDKTTSFIPIIVGCIVVYNNYFF